MRQIFKAFKIIWKVLHRKEKFCFIGVFILCLTRAFSYLGFAQVLACLTAKALGNNAVFFGITLPNSLSFLDVAAINFAIMAFFLILNIFSRNMMLRFSEGLAKTRYREYALKEILSLRKNMDLKHTTGEIIFIVESSSDAVVDYIKNLNINIVPYVFSSVIASVYLFFINIFIGISSLAMAFLIFVVAMWRTKLDKKLFKNMDIVNSKVNNNISNCINNLPFISFINSTNHEIELLKQKHKRYNKIVAKRMNIHIFYWSILYIMEYAFMFLATFLLVKNSGNTIDIDTIVLLVSYLDRLFSPINDMGYNLNLLVNHSTRVCRLDELSPSAADRLNQQENLKNERQQINYLRGHKIKKIQMKNIEIEIGQFHRAGLNATFEAGKITCICGPSGSGKTTLLGCLLGLKEYKSGSIIINDQLRVSSLFYISNKINLTLQNCTIFDRSVIENIAYPKSEPNAFAKKNIKKFELEKVAERTNNDETNLLDQLSGGEKKRISFVRAVSRRGDIYIFDEPTNDLDNKNVQLVLEMMCKVKKNDIVIVVSHDKRVIEISDEIVNL